MSGESKYNIAKNPIHLGKSGTAVAEPDFDGGSSWFHDYGIRHESDGAEGRLVTKFVFSESWNVWEMHPNGSEVVFCLSGRFLLQQEHTDGSKESISLEEGEYAINPPGTWHTADVTDAGEVSALFITCGQGTKHRSRNEDF
jgi:quercetin dioxygenase-like cupin family protein